VVSLAPTLATFASWRARALTGGGWDWATSGKSETRLGAGTPRARADALPNFNMFGCECDRAVVRFPAATAFTVRTGWPAGPLNNEGGRPEV
jgi:hypothetical protein